MLTDLSIESIRPSECQYLLQPSKYKIQNSAKKPNFFSLQRSQTIYFPSPSMSNTLTYMQLNFIIRTSRHSLETFGAMCHFIFSLPTIIKIVSDTTSLLLFVQPPIQQWIPWPHSPGVRWPEHETYHSLPSRRNILHCTSSSSSSFFFFFFLFLFFSLVPPQIVTLNSSICFAPSTVLDFKWVMVRSTSSL